MLRVVPKKQSMKFKIAEINLGVSIATATGLSLVKMNKGILLNPLLYK